VKGCNIPQLWVGRLVYGVGSLFLLKLRDDRKQQSLLDMMVGLLFLSIVGWEA
jgi:hypothetical protein